MKIGILTYHRSINIGALLQAIALRQFLLDKGHEVSFIDYWPKHHQYENAIFSLALMKSKSFINALKYVKGCISNFSYKVHRKETFRVFIKKHILPYVTGIEETYDLVIYGSDQIWRKQPFINQYNPVYFGNDVIVAYRKVSYAASMGQLPSLEEDNLIKSYLLSLHVISVREDDLMKYVLDLGLKNVRQDIDPTLLLNKEFWIDHFKLHVLHGVKKYILVYSLMAYSFDLEKIKAFAKYMGYDIQFIFGRVKNLKIKGQTIIAGPEEFLQLIYGADYVLTSSFHGLIFSLIFNKPFYAAFNHNSGRAESLLHSLSLSNRLLDPMADIPIHPEQIDFDQVNKKIKNLRDNSLLYLEQLSHEGK